jgi:hypothetical protein
MKVLTSAELEEVSYFGSELIVIKGRLEIFKKGFFTM